MLEETIVKDQVGEEDCNESSNNAKPKSELTRRDFLRRAGVVASGLAISWMMPRSLVKYAWAQTPSPCPPGQPVQTIMEITSSPATKVLQAVMKILDENKTYLAPPPDGAAGMCVTNTG